MTLQASGIISLLDIRNEHDSADVAPYDLEYYYGASEGVPDSGELAFSDFYGTTKTFNFTDTIAATTTYYNVSDKAAAAGWNVTDRLRATITVNSGVVVGSTSSPGNAFEVEFLPVGSTVYLINNGTIIGKGGAGGNGATSTVSPTVGGNGGTAIYTKHAMSITNNGIIAAGGGGGGGGQFRQTPVTTTFGTVFCNAGGGGGGAGRGYTGSSGGTGGTSSSNADCLPASNASPGGSSSSSSAGAGGAGGVSAGSSGGTGGNGGNSVAGGAGGLSGAAGGLPGYYIDGLAHVTMITVGTTLGPGKE